MEEAGQIERIFRELNVGRTTDHPALVKCIALITDSDGIPALIMSYYEGATLEQHLSKLRQTNVMPQLDFMLSVLSSLAGALAALHQKSTIHRDLKPSNVMLTRDGATLMDLGVVRERTGPDLTSTGGFLGTIRYAAPEYLFGRPYDNRADVYSLGAVAYELFTGHQFLDQEQQWARLISFKSAGWSGDDYYPPEISYGRLEARAGIRFAEFAKFVIEHSLCAAEKRDLNVNGLKRAIQERRWERPFHILHGQLISGFAQYRFPALSDSGGQLRTVEEVTDRVKAALSESDLAYLKDILRHHYWSEFFLGHQAGGPDRLRALLAAAVVHDSVGYDWIEYRVEPAVRVAYLHDLI